MTISRRRFLESAAAISLGFTGLGCVRPEAVAADILPEAGFGPLLPDPDGVIALPRGFSYRIFSRVGETMSDGFIVPTRHDGMATFPGPDGMTLLVRNHEVTPGAGAEQGAFGADLALLDRIDDPGLGGDQLDAHAVGDAKRRSLLLRSARRDAR